MLILLLRGCRVSRMGPLFQGPCGHRAAQGGPGCLEGVQCRAARVPGLKSWRVRMKDLKAAVVAHA